MSGLIILFVVVVTASSLACWRIAKKRGYDVDIFTLGGFIGGPLAVHAALNAHKYAVEVEDQDIVEPDVSDETNESETPSTDDSAFPDPLPEPSLPANPSNQVQPFLAPPPLPVQAPIIPDKGSGAPVPAIPEKLSGAPTVPAPLAGHAPPIPKALAPGIPQITAEPPLPKEIPTPDVHEEQEDDQFKDETVPAVNKTEPEIPEVAPRPRSWVELISEEPTTQRRMGPEAFLAQEEEAARPKKSKPQPSNVVLGAPDENGVPTLAIAPGEVTLGMCPHCGEDSYADWYGLCIECIQPFPVRVGYIDPTIKPDLAEATEGTPADPSKKGKLTLPKLKR